MAAFINTYREWSRLASMRAPWAVTEAAWIRYTQARDAWLHELNIKPSARA